MVLKTNREEKVGETGQTGVKGQWGPHGSKSSKSNRWRMSGAFKATQSAPHLHLLCPSLHLSLFLHKYSLTSLISFSLHVAYFSFLSFSFSFPFSPSACNFSFLYFLHSFPSFSLVLLHSVCMTHFLGPRPINHSSAVGSACLPPCLAALPHHSR